MTSTPTGTPTGPPTGPPPDRYGRSPAAGRRPAVRVLLALAVAAGVGLAAWFGLSMGQVPLDWQDVGFRVEDDAGVEVTFDVVRADPARPASCRVEALNASYAQVGVVTVPVPPSEHQRVRLTTRVATSETAVTGTVTSCRTDG